MTTTFAIDVVQALQEHEAEEFNAFLDSPYFTKGFNSDVKPFFQLIYKAIREGNLEKLEKEDLHTMLFGKKTFVESKVDKLMSDLKRLLEKFLLTQRYFSEEQEWQQLLDLSSVLRLKGLGTRHQQTLEKAEKKIKGSNQESLKTLFFRFLLATEEQEWLSTYNKAKGDLNIPEVLKHLDVYYFARKTSILNQLKLQQKATQLPHRAESRDLGEWRVPEKVAQSSSLVGISWAIYELLDRQTLQEEDLQVFLSEVRESEPELSPESLAESYTYLRNLCVILIDEGHTHLHALLHEINKDNLQRGYFYLNGQISPNACLSIAQTALSAGEIFWLREFVEQHKDSIIGDNETRDFYRMNKALYLFGEKNFEEAINIVPFSSSYSFYHLMARRLELKAYYELRSELLDFKVDAFKMFIRRTGRKMFPANVHDLYINFVNFVRQLSQSQGPEAKKRSAVLVKRISEKKVVAERLWLLEKARELGEKR